MPERPPATAAEKGGAAWSPSPAGGGGSGAPIATGGGADFSKNLTSGTLAGTRVGASRITSGVGATDFGAWANTRLAPTTRPTTVPINPLHMETSRKTRCGPAAALPEKPFLGERSCRESGLHVLL